MLRLAEKAFYPAKIPFPVLQVDTGYDFPEVLATRDNWVNRLGVRLIVASVEEAIANGVVVDDGKTSPQPAPDRHPAQRHRGGRLHRRLRWRPPRRGEGPRQGAGLLPPRRVRPVGPEDAAPRAVEPLQRPHPRGRAHADLPDLQLDRAGHLGLHRPRGHRDPHHLLLPPAPRLRARRDAAHRERVQPVPRRARPSRSAPSGSAPSATSPSPAASSPTPTPSPRSSTRSPSPGSPSAARPAVTTGSPKQPWRTGRRKATSDERVTSRPAQRPTWTCSASPPPARSTTASPPSSGGCCSTPSRSSRTSSRPSRPPAPPRATTTPTSRC